MKRKILVTGARGFIATHLIKELEKTGHEVLRFDRGNSNLELEGYALEADTIFHLAGSNRPINTSEFWETNALLTKRIVEICSKGESVPAIFLSSSIQVELDNDYGKSKAEAEKILLGYRGEKYIFRLPNVFGPGARQNYNSVVATFCYNLTHNLPLRVDDQTKLLSLVYVRDVVNCFISAMQARPSEVHQLVGPIYSMSVGDLVTVLSQGGNNEPLHIKLLETLESYKED